MKYLGENFIVKIKKWVLNKLADKASINGATFYGPVLVNSQLRTTSGIGQVNGTYLPIDNPKYYKSNFTFAGDGSIADIGTLESFIFTLEDGTKVTKQIRIVSTTNS